MHSEASSDPQQHPYHQPEQSPDLSNSLSPASVYSDTDDYHHIAHAPPLLPTIMDHKSYTNDHQLRPILINPYRHYY
ncbi:hypothetical protein MAM1_0282d09208 [Mucor ambiguus]|uniref:Uncharacterized protein n=1 Tax=Mucor ambiguus TaxID=91626 RepID=A0A0C9MG38_9FUNG|nr:hypothetical protein MAM1_0282d09208 [Mucor ambiguus]